MFDLSNFNTKRLEQIYNMIFGCNSLTSVNLAKFNAEKAINISLSFYNCRKLVFVIISSFNSHYMKYIDNYIISLKVDLF